MKFNKIIFYMLFTILLSSFIWAEKTYTNYDNSLLVEGPEKVNVLDKFQIKINVDDEDVINYANLIELSCSMIILNNQITDQKLISKGYISPLKYYQYNGEEEIVLDVAINFDPIPSPQPKTIPCNIKFMLVTDDKDEKLKNELKEKHLSDYLTRPINQVYYNPDSVGIEFNINIPKTQISKDKVSTYISALPTDYVNPIRFTAGFDTYGNTQNFTAGTAIGSSYNLGNDKIFDFKNSDYQKFFEMDNSAYNYEIRNLEETKTLPQDIVKSQKGTSGYYRILHKVSENSWENKEKGIREVIITTYFNARINYYGSTNMIISFHNGNRVDETKVDTEMKRIESDIMNYIKSLEMKSETINYPIYSKKETKTQEKEEIKDVQDRDINIKLKNKERTIWNTGKKNTNNKETDTNFEILLALDITAKDEDGKTIKNPNKDKLYENIFVIAKILENNSQLGLGSDLSKNWKKKASSNLDTIEVFGKGPLEYDGPFKPIEYIEVYLSDDKDKIITQKLKFKVNIKDGTPKIILKKSLIEVQDGDKRAVEFKIEDADSKKLKCKITVPTSFAYRSGIPTSYIEYEGKQTTYQEIDCKSGETVKVMYYAPKKLGNFDLNGELNALSMWKLQEGTAVNLVTDLVGLGVEKRLKFLGETSDLNQRFANLNPKNIDSLKRAQQFGQAHDFLDKANKISTHSQNIIKVTQVQKNAQNTEKLFNQSVGLGKQGWVEWGADWGVFGIDVAQSTVGAVLMAPGKIPVVGSVAQKITGKLSLVFNLMTNVWKGNLEYLSKVEKINRAQEFYLPYPIIIQVEDEDKMSSADIQNIMIAYNWLE